MADELKMVHGEVLWQDKYNRLVDTVEKMEGVVDDLQWTKQTKDGLVFPSGVEYVDGGYSYIQLGNRKLVFLSVAVKVTSDVKELAFSNLITLPDEIASNSQWIHWLGGLTEFQLLRNEIMIGDTNGNATRQWNNRNYFITALYVA